MAIEYYNIEMASQKYVNFFQIYGCENKKIQSNRAGRFHPTIMLFTWMFIYMDDNALFMFI